MKKNVLAIDLGASSGRGILGSYDHGTFQTEEVHRFTNYPKEKDGVLFWDYPTLLKEVKMCIQKAEEKGSLTSVGIDTWGVDVGFLDENNQLIQSPICYRDPYTKGILEEVKSVFPLKELYQKTGTQIMEINTLFQLLALRNKQPKVYQKIKHALFVSDLLNYHLTGKMATEMSIASTAQLLNTQKRTWQKEVFETFDLPQTLFSPLVKSGECLGQLVESQTKDPVKLYNVCQHDTQSAILCTAPSKNSLYISCGTWSLIGTELEEPILSKKAFQNELTNEVGYQDKISFLKNCTGLWIIQEVRRELAENGEEYSFGELASLAKEAPAFQCFIDTDAEVFSRVGQMIAKIQDYAKKTQQKVPKTPGELARCVYESLTMKYKYVMYQLSESVEKDFNVIHILGGGSQAEILCQFVTNATNIPVHAGPVEASAIGNLSLQLLGEGVFSNIAEVKNWIDGTFEVKTYLPEADSKVWEQAFSNYLKLIEGENKNGKLS